MTDVLMYYNDVMLCYGITADELKHAYTEKLRRICTAGNAPKTNNHPPGATLRTGGCVLL